MHSIFNSISNKSRAQSNLNTQPKRDLNQTVLQWQKKCTPQNTKVVLQLLKPTIQSALHTYVPGQQSSFKIKASAMALQSLRQYKPTKGASPKTFVFTNLQRLNRLRRQRQNLIHIPESQVYAKQLVEKKITQLSQDLGRDPTDEQLQDATGMSKKKLQRVLSAGTTIFNDSASMDQNQRASTFSVSDLSDQDYFKYVYNSVGPLDKKIMQWTSPKAKVQLSNNQIAKKLRLSAGAVSQRKAKIQQLLGSVRGLL